MFNERTHSLNNNWNANENDCENKGIKKIAFAMWYLNYACDSVNSGNLIGGKEQSWIRIDLISKKSYQPNECLNEWSGEQIEMICSMILSLITIMIYE